MTRAFLALASLAVAVAGFSAAEAKPAKPKAAKPPVSITVENKRTATLNAMQIVQPGAKEGDKETVVATLA